MKGFFAQLQRIGKALILPVVVLPAAALLLRLGAADLLDIPVITRAGGILFDNLALLFAIGVAVGLSFDNAGAAGLAGAVGYLVITEGAQTINPDINMGVLAGILAGCIAGSLYNKFHNVKLPDFLGLFAGRRFVPIITGGVSVLAAAILGYLWPFVQDVIYSFGQWLTTSGPLGVGVYGLCNQLLIPTGLHHVINTLAWFVFGSFKTAAGEVVTGDLWRYFAGDPSAGNFMTGFFPIFMFGMPAAALAMYRTARKENRKAVGGVLFSAALTFAVTGIGEPLLFTFCFVAPLLYVIHALLTGTSLFICTLLGVKHGFGFSAGLIDYLLNYGLSTKGWLIIPIGIVYFIIYYFLFTFFITKFNLATPGREEGVSLVDLDKGKKDLIEAGGAARADIFIELLGGPGNINLIDACITRLRLKLNEVDSVDEEGLKAIGVPGILKVGNSTQIIVGTKAEAIAEEINSRLKDLR